MNALMIFGDFLFVGLNISLGVLVAAMFIAHTVYRPMVDSDDDRSYLEIDYDTDSISPTSSDCEENEIYEEKYDEEYAELKEKELTEDELKELKNNILIETTPIGNVLMFYDQDYEYFKYYSDTKEISYQTLEAVSKKYVITNDCKQIYIEMNEEILRQNEKKTSELSDRKDNSEKVGGEPLKESVFATLKTYNVKDNKRVESKNVYIKEKINIYKYAGRIEEYTISKSSEKEKVLKLDFVSFKRIMGELDEKKKIV